MTVEIILPWPPAILNPNNMSHWTAKAKAKKAHGVYCWVLARKNVPVFPEGSIRLELVMHPPNRRHRDLDNFLSSLKSGLDFVAQAWGINDKRFNPVTVSMGEVVKHGKVVLRAGE